MTSSQLPNIIGDLPSQHVRLGNALPFSIFLRPSWLQTALTSVIVGHGSGVCAAISYYCDLHNQRKIHQHSSHDTCLRACAAFSNNPFLRSVLSLLFTRHTCFSHTSTDPRKLWIGEVTFPPTFTRKYTQQQSPLLL